MAQQMRTNNYWTTPPNSAQSGYWNWARAKKNITASIPKSCAVHAEHAETLNLGISLKPHGGISLTAKELIDLYHQVNHPAFAVSYDPGNIIHYTRGEVRPEQEVDDIAKYTSTAIIKDCALDAENNPNVQTTAGDGEVDFHRILSGLTGGGFTGPLYVECVGSKTPEGIDRDLAFTLGYIRGILSSIGCC